MAPGIYKSFRKLWDKNLEKYKYFVGYDNFIDEIKTSKDMSEELIESIIGYDTTGLTDGIKEINMMNKYNDIYTKIAMATMNDLTRETYQAMEAFVANLNTLHSRAGGQVPFSSINLGTDTSNAGRLVTKNLLLAMEAGLGHGETCIFPIVIFKVKEGVNYNPGDKNYDLFKLSFRVTGKRLFPNYIFLDSPFNLQYYKPGHPESEVAQMGCRTRVMGNVYDPDREIAYSRGNLSFTTINLPMLALEAKKFTDGDVEKTFYELLDKYLEISKKQLLERFELQSHLKVKNLPFLMGQGVWLDSDKLGPEDEVGEILKHGSLSIGFIGLAEALVALYGHHHGEGKEYWDKGYNIIKHMREYTDKLAEETHLNFSVLATPSEGLCGTALRKTKKMFGEIEGVTDKEYFTNSSHIPVSFNISIYDKIKLEAPFHELCNAGHIAYVEIDGDAAANTEAIESIVRTMHDLNVGYGAINHPVDRDPVCGYTGVIGDKCPNCGRTEGDIKFDRIRRVTGYLAGTLDMFNDAKRAEERDRVKHGGINNL